jgi:16S rRNA (guanine527-N7)-methyltransferase
LKLLLKYFPDLTPLQIQQFEKLIVHFKDWNSKINLIARTDIDHLEERHILHSLAIAKVHYFHKGSTVLDVGTGGGFPGLPLAILLPDTTFTMVDSIGKKIMVVNDLIEKLDLKNAIAYKTRAEDITDQFDFIISRAVTRLKPFYSWISKNIKRDPGNGVYYLKGGNLTDEIKELNRKTIEYRISDFYTEQFFETKKVLYLPI